MNKDNIEEILNKLGAEEVPEQVHKIAEETSRDFSENLIRKKQTKHYVLQEHIMKSRIPKLAIAAAIIIVVLVGLPFLSDKEKGVALADVLAKVEQASAFMYKMKMNMTGSMMPDMPAMKQDMEMTIIISREYGWKWETDMTDPNTGKKMTQTMYILPEQKSMVMVMPEMKQYMQMEFDDELLAKMKKEKNDPREMIKQIMGSEYKELGKSVIDGVEVEGFETTDPAFAEGMMENVKVELWVDVETWLPVRVEMDLRMGEQMQMSGVIYDYQWDIPVDASEFEPVIPEDYTSMTSEPIKAPSINEEGAIEGLKFFADILGYYPKSLDMISLMKEFTAMKDSENLTEAGLKLKEEMYKFDRQKDMQKNIGKTMELMRPVQSLAMFYMTLLQDKKEPAYYGESVGPDDTDLVLMRWKISDNEYRVIFGDLSAENVTAEELLELEKSLPK